MVAYMTGIGRSASRWLAVAVLWIMPWGSSAAEALPLVKDGAPLAVLIRGANLSASEVTAVKEFQRILKDMTGTALVEEGIGESGESGRPEVWIGHDLVAAAHPELDLESLLDEGFVIRVEGKRLLLAGGKKRGTLYAVFSFFEILGCRYWTPTEETIPVRKTITVPPLDVREKPGMEYRDMLYADANVWGDAHHDGTTWGVRNKRNGFGYYDSVSEEWGGRIDYKGSLVHSYDRLMKPIGNLDGSFASHPEYWALRGGKRSPSQPCLSNPKVLEIMTANVLNDLREHPSYHYVVVGQNDNKGYCQCDACNQLYETYTAPSGAVLQLANRIAEEIEKVRPDVWVLAPAYEWSRKPPNGIVPRCNVGTVLCSIECDFNRPWEDASTEANMAFKEDVAAWGRIAQRLYVWDYTTNFSHYLLPHPNLNALGPNIDFLVRNKCQGILAQGSHTVRGGEFAPLRMWVLAKLMWNPRADARKLIEEFVAGYYGPAAQHILAYIDVMHSVGRENPGMRLSTYSAIDAPWLTPAVIAESEALFRRAHEAVKDDPVLTARVLRAHLPVLYVLLKRQPGDPTWKAVAERVGSLEPEDLAAMFVSDKVNVIAEGEPSEHFYEWVGDYYGRQVTSDTVPVPPELRGMPRESFRLIQACQMDSRARWWRRHEGASDGWVTDCATPAWTIRKNFLPSGTCAPLPGKTYRLFARLKTTEPKVATGQLGSVGLWGDRKRVERKLLAGESSVGEWCIVEVGDLSLDDTPVTFYIAANPNAVDHIWLDCIWLLERETAPPE